MTATQEVQTTVTLTLNDREAAWLKALMQNPIGCRPEDEDEQDRQMRNAFWNALEMLNF